jgi:hypothetical protein
MDGVPKVQARTEPPAPLQLVLQPPAALPVRLVGVRLFVEQFYRRIKAITARGQTVEKQTKPRTAWSVVGDCGEDYLQQSVRP